MPLVSHTIPGLYNGVSQQPVTVRLPTQGENQVNAVSSLVTGLSKRPPSEHVTSVGYSGVDASNMLVHTINRDETERYIVTLTDGDLRVFDLDGVENTVFFPEGRDYLRSTDPKQDFKVVTVADYSFIINSTVKVAMRADRVHGDLAGTKQLFADVNPAEAEGVFYEIAGDPTNSADNYYVKKSGGVWIEEIKPGELLGFNAYTMPFRLTRESNGTFIFKTIAWGDRLVGDRHSSPEPSFVGDYVNDVFFHRNRLGFISGENVIFSAAADFFNFWRESVLDVLDSDTVDVSVSHAKVSTLEHAVPFNRSLLLFSEQTQFMLTGEEALTPKTVKIDQITAFETSPKARPESAGPNMYFVVERGKYAGVKEYYVSEDSVTNDAADITKHVPLYIPSGVFKIAASSNEDILFLLTEGERNSIFVYKFFWQGEEKKQSSWSKWTFDETDVILNVDIIGTVLYLTVSRTEGVFLEKIDFQEENHDDVGYQVLLDRKHQLVGTYRARTRKTTWNMPFDDPGDIQVVLGPDFGADSGALLGITKVTDGVLEIAGDYSAGYVYVGRKYVMTYGLSEQTVKQENLSVLNSKLQLRTLTLDYVSSGNFDVTVTAKARKTYTYPYTGRVLGSGNLLLGSPVIESGRFRLTVMNSAEDVTIEIKNDSPMPSKFQSAEWEGFYNTRSKPI